MPKIGRFLVSVFLPFSIVSIAIKSRIGVDSLIGGYKNGWCLQIGGRMHLTIPLLINDNDYIHLVCRLVLQVRAHLQGRQRGEKAQLQSDNVLRSVVSGADIASMACAIVVAPDSPPLPQSSRELADARVATREAQQGLLTSPCHRKCPKTAVASQLIAESQSLLSPESKDESAGNSLVAAVEVHVDS